MQWESTTYTYGRVRQPPELCHYGIKGQKWGLRRYQYENGSYTPEGKERYRKLSGSSEPAKGIPKGSEKKGNTEADKEEARKKQNGKDRDEWKAKDVNELSDEELRRRNNRLQAEQNYKNSMTPEWKKTARTWGKEAVHAVIFAVVGVGIGVITAVLKNKLPPSLKEKSNKVLKKAGQKKISEIKG